MIMRRRFHAFGGPDGHKMCQRVTTEHSFGAIHAYECECGKKCNSREELNEHHKTELQIAVVGN